MEPAATAKSVRVLALSHHAGYACRRSGACCTAGWRIPVEAERVEGVRTLLSDAEAFEPGTRILRLTAAGGCVLFSGRNATPSADADGGRGARTEPSMPSECTLHRERGHAALPAACRHFPRRYLHDGHATRVTLSHFCPTAASMLFESGAIEIVEAPPALAPPRDREGLDARAALPPLLRPDLLMDVASYALWEARAIETLGGADTPEGALRQIAASAERLRNWEPGASPLAVAVREAFDEPHGDERAWIDEPGMTGFLLTSAATAVAPDLRREPSPVHPEADRTFVVPAWSGFSAPIRRYLAGRLFGSWMPYQGRGLRTVVASGACALAVLRSEATRACAAASHPLDQALLTEAVRAADLLLVHEADSQALADRLAAVEYR